MSAHIIDGKSVAEQIVAECARAAGAFASPPGLAVILAGDNPASRVYVRNKERACARAGFYSEKIELPDSISESELLAVVAAKNADPKIHGILLQLPLPSQINSARALAAISPRKDVDGFHAENIGLLAQNRPGLRPCTPAGCIELLRRAGTQIKGAHAVVVGRSDIVGKPMALLLLHESATVTICHSQTRDLTAFTRAARYRRRRHRAGAVFDRRDDKARGDGVGCRNQTACRTDRFAAMSISNRRAKSRAQSLRCRAALAR